MQFACDNIVSSSELSLLHLGPVQIPRFTQIWNSDQSKYRNPGFPYFDWSEFLCVWLFSWRRGGLCLVCFFAAYGIDGNQ